MPVPLHPSLRGGPISPDELSGLPQELPFSNEEYRERLRRVRQSMAARDIEVLMVQHPPNIYYISGHQSFSMHNEECVILPAEGEPSLVVHPPELGTALLHSWFDARFGYAADQSHEAYLATLLAERGLERARVGLEMRSPAVSAGLYGRLKAALPGADLVDGSGVVETVKATKSAKEIEYLRQAARITDAGVRAAIEASTEGGTDNDVAAAANLALVQAGSEYVSLAPIVTTGRRSGILHSTHKRVRLSRGDSVLIEMGGCYQRYTSPLMRTVSIGGASPDIERVANACLTALGNVIATIRPGVTADEVARAGWEGIDRAGAGLVFHGNFGYAVGAGFPPAWADGTAKIELGDKTRLRPGMVFHHPIALRRLGQFGVAFSETSLVTEDGCEVLTGVERLLFVR